MMYRSWRRGAAAILGGIVALVIATCGQTYPSRLLASVELERAAAIKVEQCDARAHDFGQVEPPCRAGQMMESKSTLDGGLSKQWGLLVCA